MKKSIYSTSEYLFIMISIRQYAPEKTEQNARLLYGVEEFCEGIASINSLVYSSFG